MPHRSPPPKPRRPPLALLLRATGLSATGLAILIAAAWAVHTVAQAGTAPPLVVTKLGTRNPLLSMVAMYPGATGASPSALPVILFNPGWRAPLRGYLDNLKTLARNGYIVVGIERDAALTRRQGALDLSSEDAYRGTLRRADAAARRQAAEMSALLDELRPDSFPGATADLARVGIYGHSFGGAVAFQSCLADRRFAACANIDGWLFADAARAAFPQPWLVVTDEVSTPDAAFAASDAAGRRGNQLSRRNAEWIAAQAGRPHTQVVEIPGADHGAFIDDVGWRGLPRHVAARLRGRTDPAVETDRALRAFFGRWLEAPS